MVKKTTKKKTTSKKTHDKAKHEHHKEPTCSDKCNGKCGVFGLILAGIFAVLFILALTTNIFNSNGPAISEDQVKTQTLEMIDNLLQGQAEAKVSAINYNEESGLYEMTLTINGQEQPTAYASGNGELFFPQALPITGEKTTPATTPKENTNTQQAAAPVVTKSDKPKVELFIMAYCPYGLQMQKAYIPVMELLGDKADMSVKWVNYAMHGEKEIIQNSNQYCIQKEYPSKYTAYARCFIGSDDPEGCMAQNGINKATIDTCVAAADTEFGISADFADKASWSGGRYPRYRVNQAENEAYGVRGSPTLVINGETVSVSRSQEAVKQAVCNAFNNAPAECSTTLSTSQEQPSIGAIGAGSDSGSAAPAADCGA